MFPKRLLPTSTGESQRPDGWREVSLSLVADVRFSSVDKLTYPSEEPVRLCNYIDVYNNDYITGDLEFMRASATQPEISRFGLQVGDVLITKDSETPDEIGIPAVVDYAPSDLVCGYHLALIRPNELQRYSLEAGDLLFARRSLNLEGAGLCSIVPSLDESTTFESSIIRVRLEKTKMVARFTAEFLRSECGYLLRRPFIRQVAVSGVSSEDVGHFLVPCPPLNEQSRILTLLELYDRAVSSHQNELRKLTYLKSALMSDLLTGRVRVPADILKENP